MTERHLSRRVWLESGTRRDQHAMSVVTLERLLSGRVRILSVEPFKGESEAVVYHDFPLILKEVSDGEWEISEMLS